MILRSLSLSLILILCGVPVSSAYHSILNDRNPPEPAVDGLKLQFQPYVEQPEQEPVPVQVLKFVVDLGDDNMWVHEWRLKNRSDKKVVKIRRALFVYDANDPAKLLLRYQVGPDDSVGISVNEIWPRGKCQGYYCPNSFGMLSATNLLKPLAKDGNIEGNYIIALGIDKVTFSDGTVWEFPAEQNK
jgi:hypothetical protein